MLRRCDVINCQNSSSTEATAYAACDVITSFVEQIDFEFGKKIGTDDKAGTGIETIDISFGSD